MAQLLTVLKIIGFISGVGRTTYLKVSKPQLWQVSAFCPRVTKQTFCRQPHQENLELSLNRFRTRFAKLKCFVQYVLYRPEFSPMCTKSASSHHQASGPPRTGCNLRLIWRLTLDPREIYLIKRRYSLDSQHKEKRGNL